MEGLQIFNPGNQSEKEITKNFSIRFKEFNKILRSVKTDKMKNAPQHFIIQGVRGSGKTTLLLRLYYEIKRDSSLNNWLIPIVFSEEQYGVNKLFKLWEQIAIELENESDKYEGLIDKIQDIALSNYEEYSYKALFSELKNTNQKICVLWDNIGDFLKKLNKKEQQQFREILITNNQIRIIGASSEVLEATYKYDQPFYEFFKIVQLQELKSKETKNFLLNIDQLNNSNKIQKIIDHHPGKIETLRILTGGVPRTIVLMYEIFINDQNGDSFKYLEILLDRVTPLYKHRMDDLATQQQEIVDCIALNWDAIAVKDIAKTTRLKSKIISAQLKLLEKNNVVIKKTTSTKNNLYQVKERFFNIWYIMRNGRKSDKKKVIWLTKFLELWGDNQTLDEMLENHLAKLKEGNVYDKYAYHLSEAFASLTPSPEKQQQLLSETKSYLTRSKSSIAGMISDSDWEFIEKKVDPLINEKDYDKAIYLLSKRDTNTGVSESKISYICYQHKKDINKAKEYCEKAIEKGDALSMRNLGFLYHNEYKDFIKAEKYYLMAIDNNDIVAMFNLALLYENELKDFGKAEEYYLMAIDNNDINAMNNLAYQYFQNASKQQKAERLVKKAFNIKTHSTIRHNYALILLWNNKIDEAIQISEPIFENENIINDYIKDIELLLNMFIAKHQVHFVHRVFKKNKHQIKDRLKPIYYALMHFMQDQYPDEIRKMGSELEETVNSIISIILELREKYK